MLRATLPIFLFLFFGVFANAQTQSMMTASEQEAAISWKSQATIEQMLTDRIVAVNAQLPSFQPGTQPYENALRRVAYYKAIMDAIEDGAAMSRALEQALTAAATLGGTQEVSYTPKVVLRALHDETRILLSN